MDWNWEESIEVNGKALRWIVTVLFAMAGLVSDAVVETLPRRVHRAIVHVLYPAESALRRLILVATRIGTTGPPDMAWAGLDRRARRDKARSRGKRKGGGDVVPAFPLCDPRKPAGPPRRKTVPGPGPRIRHLDDPHDPAYDRTVPMPDDPVRATALVLRLLALKAALDDLPAQVRRMKRLLARRGRKWPDPLRRRRPPGHREGGREWIDEVLANCQTLALWALYDPEPG